MVTHDVYGACRVADRIGLLKDGQITTEFERRPIVELIPKLSTARLRRWHMANITLIAKEEWSFWLRSKLAVTASYFFVNCCVDHGRDHQLCYR